MYLQSCKKVIPYIWKLYRNCIVVCLPCSISFSFFSQHAMKRIFKYIKKLKELYNQWAYSYRLEPTINIFLCFITCVSIYQSLSTHYSILFFMRFKVRYAHQFNYLPGNQCVYFFFKVKCTYCGMYKLECNLWWFYKGPWLRYKTLWSPQKTPSCPFSVISHLTPLPTGISPSA